MSKNKTVNTNMIEPNTTFMVRGNLTFSRLTRFLEGKALEDDIARRRQKGWQPTSERPYMTATVCNAQVIKENPNAETNAEIYARESMYTSKNSQGYCFTAKRTAPTLPGNSHMVDYSKNIRRPWLCVMEADGKTITQIEQKGELDNGLDVTLLMRVFKSGTGMNNGVSLEGVILHEPVRYYNGASQQALESRGLIFKPNPNVQAMTPPEQQDVQPQAQVPFSDQPAAPAAPQAGNEFNNNPQPQQAQMPQGQPIPNNGFPMNAPNNQSAFVPSGQPQAAPAPMNPNPSGFQGSESQGIHYNPQDMGRAY